MHQPYGTIGAAPLPVPFTPNMSGVSFDAARQVSVVGGAPVVESPTFLGAHAVTWGDTANGDSSGDGVIA